MGSTDIDMKPVLIAAPILIFIFSIGLYLQIKIIKIVRQEQSMSWEINMCHSIVMIIHYIFTISIEMTTYLIPSLSRNTGMWFCYVASFVRGYGASAIVMHSLYISIYKYIFIVHDAHDETSIKYGKDTAKKLIFWIKLINPVFASMCFMVRPHFRPYSEINSCGGPIGWQYQVWQNPLPNHTNGYQSIENTLKQLFFCDFDNNDVDNGFDYFMYVSNQVYCLVQTVITFLIAGNLLEIFFYVKIFRYMKR